MTSQATPSSSGNETPEPLISSGVGSLPSPPVAGQRPHSFTRHGVTIEDPWHWLRDPKYPTVEDAEVLAYLTAENEYFEAAMLPHRELVETIFEEIKGRQQPDLSSVPWKRGDWYYQWSYQEGSQYRVWQRWPADNAEARTAPTEDASTILDEPGLAEGLEVLSPRLFFGEQRRVVAGLQRRYRRLRTVQDGGQGPGHRGTSEGGN